MFVVLLLSSCVKVGFRCLLMFCVLWVMKWVVRLWVCVKVRFVFMFIIVRVVVYVLVCIVLGVIMVMVVVVCVMGVLLCGFRVWLNCVLFCLK